jgi:hypothetical protein
MSKLGHWSTPAPLTDLRALRAEISDLPRDIDALVNIVQGLILHAHWRERYGVPIDHGREGELQFRRVDDTLARALALAASPLTEARPPAQRVLGVCRHFTVVLAAFLRAQGRPARARCGFADYFDPQRLSDHWVCEIWDEMAGAWRLVDAQLDMVQRTALELDFDPLDVPRNRFVIAGDAWQRCRAGELDPQRCGIFDLHGLWFVAANVVRDLAAFEKCEMLPWDVWGAMFPPDATPSAETLMLLDQAAQATLDPDGVAARAFYASHDAFRVPSRVTAAFPEPKSVDVTADFR